MKAPTAIVAEDELRWREQLLEQLRNLWPSWFVLGAFLAAGRRRGPRPAGAAAADILFLDIQFFYAGGFRLGAGRSFRSLAARAGVSSIVFRSGACISTSMRCGIRAGRNRSTCSSGGAALAPVFGRYAGSRSG